ncbi:MAG: glutamate--cysteine ligase [Phenylobacterium sp.]|uniref:glutamate--cysteine ligase n=1 Tax=Phenylobacterium sp. TaxID=1871053 RepID=UPI002733E468|nr:glutamate--cysteine ligase [Phenylobacterium sp.]MDP3173898.1 glutamate--cysteine ligase [Phenylobacterium sp.]
MGEVVCDDRPLVFEDLVRWFEVGSKPAAQWRVGAEHEKFPFRLQSHDAVAYEGAGIKALMEGLQRFGWTGVFEASDAGPVLIGLERDGANVSLEPGGQFELSGAPLQTMHEIRRETEGHLDEAKTVAAELGIGFLALGFTPLWRRDQVPVMPKGRYAIMRAYMPKVGGKGLDMMFRTCTVQANLDFGSEADMVAKFRTSLALQPIATALFANSPFKEGRPTGLLSSRADVWTDTDPDRTGMLDFVFQDGFGFESYARYALDVPMYFAKRKDRYVDLSGRSFRKFMDGDLAELPGERPTLKDWADHTTTIFPEVRLKQYLEMRGADSGPAPMLHALPALWTGIFYDSAALAAAWDLCKGWTTEQHNALRADVARRGMKAEIAGRTVQAVAKDLLAIAREGLARRARLEAGVDETIYLAPLDEIADSGLTQADRQLELFHGAWNGDASKAFDDWRY